MQTSKKRIYGAVGLATVVGMTAVAHSIPAPEAHAESKSATVGLQVTVVSQNIDLVISGPLQDGGSTSDSSVTIPIVVTDVKDLQYVVTASQDGISGSQTVATATIPLSESGNYTGTYNLTLPLSSYRDYLATNYGYDSTKPIKFTLKATGFGYGSGAAEDSITFTYGHISIDPSDNINPSAPDNETNVPTTEDGDPIINIGTDDEVEKVHVVVRDPETGDVVWEGDVPSSDIQDGKIVLPFDENNVPSGNYQVEVYAYDSNGNLIGVASLVFRYVRPDGPGLPNTGGVSIAGLNIARADFLISSALAFCLVSLGGIYLLVRKTRK